MNITLENSLNQSMRNRVAIIVIGLLAVAVSIALLLVFGAKGYLVIPTVVAVASLVALIVNMENYGFLFGEALREGIRTY